MGTLNPSEEFLANVTLNGASNRSTMISASEVILVFISCLLLISICSGGFIERRSTIQAAGKRHLITLKALEDAGRSSA
jgi:hypothetical protein